MAETKFKVRSRWNLPHAMPPSEWLDLVLETKPTTPMVGAVTSYMNQVVVAVWAGGKVHAVPIEDCGRGGKLWTAMPADQRENLEGWHRRYRDGEFAVLSAKLDDKAGSW